MGPLIEKYQQSLFSWVDQKTSGKNAA